MSAALDQVFSALADPARRAVIKRLARGPASVSELASPFDMALPSFTQHLNILEESGLICSRKDGRVRTFKLVPKQIAKIEGWLEEQRSLWERRLDQLDSFLLDQQKKEKK